MKTLVDLPEDVRKRVQQHASIALERRASNSHADIALHTLYMLGAVLASQPQFWTVIEALAAGDFQKADDALQ